MAGIWTNPIPYENSESYRAFRERRKSSTPGPGRTFSYSGNSNGIDRPVRERDDSMAHASRHVDMGKSEAELAVNIRKATSIGVCYSRLYLTSTACSY